MNFQASAPKIAPRILCIGIPVRDLTFRVAGDQARGSKENASHFEEICGGNSLNAAIGIVRLGGRASMCGPMGDSKETASRYIFEQLGHESLVAQHLVQLECPVPPIPAILPDPPLLPTLERLADPLLWKFDRLGEATRHEYRAPILLERGSAGIPT